MNVPTNDHQLAVASNTNHAPERLHTSTRILADAGALPECAACGRGIDNGTRYKCVTLRKQGGEIRELTFCGADCLGQHDVAGTE